MDIYKISYGMVYSGDNPTFVNIVMLHNQHILPVYAIDNGSEYVELVSQVSIPKVIDDKIPGFGAYRAQKLVTKSELRTFANYMTWIKDNCRFDYIRAFRTSKKAFDERHDKYLQTHSDEYGPLSEFSPERERRNRREFDNTEESAMNVASELIRGGKQFKK